METIKEIIKKYCYEMRNHIDQFGKGENRNIDTREKGTMIIAPKVIETRLRKEAINIMRKHYHPDKTTIPLYVWIDFFNITEEDLK